MRIAIVASGVLILLSNVTAQAQILKCVGKDGKIEFATSCPPGTKQQETGVSSRPAPAAAPAKDDKGGKGADKGTPKSLADQDADYRKRQAEQKEAAAKSDKAAADDARRKQACDDARSYRKRLEDRQRTTRTDPNTGERVFFEEQDFVRETAAAERTIAENCK